MRRLVTSRSGKALAALLALGVPLAAFAEPAAIVTNASGIEGRLEKATPCPGSPNWIAFQRILDREVLHVVDTATGEIAEVSSVAPSEASRGGRGSYEGEPDWMPVPDAAGNRWLAYTGGGRVNNKDVYITYVGAGRSWRLTNHPDLDTSPRVSPDGKRIVFVSSRSGRGDLYLIEGLDRIRTGILEGVEPVPEAAVRRLTTNEDQDIHPAFDPSGRFVAYSQWTLSAEERSTEANMGIAVLDLEKPENPPVRLLLDAEQETRPAWSPDGHRIAYYTSERIEDSQVDVGLVKVAFGEKSGSPLFGALVETGVDRRVARDVVPGETRGPSWVAGGPRGHSKALSYVRMTEGGDRALVLADVDKWENGKVDYESAIPVEPVQGILDVIWGFDGTLVFSGQADRNYGIYRVPAPGDLLAEEGTFDRLIAPDSKGGGFPLWGILAGGAGLVLAGVALLGGGGDGGGGDGFTTGDPPCPPGVDCGTPSSPRGPR